MDDPTDEEESQESVSESESDEPLSPEQRIEELEQELELAKKDLLYRQAEVQNALSQVAKTRSEGVRYGATGLARRIVGSVENIERALEHVEEDAQDSLSTGIRLLYSEIISSLTAEGVVKIDTVGQLFDPARMEAITTIPPSDEYPSGHVASELESGWMLRDRVLKVARVVVTSDENQ
ncbi:MAG: nucleotide exchange factor GrpE [Candidatus Thermoplasmatota archaeon]|nr:nucleotide exchange factor GrpE [Candidatus Thermoplasmatota archaeon]